MLRKLENETGLILTFKKEILSDEAGLDTILFELADEEKSYLLAVAYSRETEAAFEQLNDALWQGKLLHRKAILLLYTGENLRRLIRALPRDGKTTVSLSESGLQPDFAMTRFSEIYDPAKCILLKIDASGQTVYLPVYLDGTTAHLGTWMSPVSRSGLIGAMAWLFREHREIKEIAYKNTPYSVLLDPGWRHNDFFLALPESVEALRSGMTKKSRYNLNREKRIIEEQLGGLAFENIPAESISHDVIETFYRFKNATHKITQKDYDITKLPITDYYLLKTGDGETRAIALSCEQGKDVFIENHTFDSSMREYSFGKHVYEMYIEALIGKGKTGLALAGGSLDYKNRYGTFCAITWSGEVTRSAYRVWKALRCFGSGNKPLTIRRWTGRAAHVKQKLTAKKQ